MIKLRVFYFCYSSGFYYQVYISQFGVPGFPLSLVFWPFSVAEEYLKYQVTES